MPPVRSWIVLASSRSSGSGSLPAARLTRSETSAPGEPGEPHSHDVLGAAQVGERLRQLRRQVGLGVAEGREEQQAGAPGRAGQVPQEQKRRGVRPVPVLEHEQDRPSAADVGEQVGDRRVEAVALGVGVGLDRLRQLADQGRQIGQQPGQLAAAGAERGPQLARPRSPAPGDRAPRRRARRASAPPRRRRRRGRAPLRPRPGRRTRAPGGSCPAPGSPASSATRRPSPSARGIRRPELLQLGRAADERRGRGRAERARKVRDLSVHGKTIVSLDHSRPAIAAVRRPANWVRSGHDRGARPP